MTTRKKPISLAAICALQMLLYACATTPTIVAVRSEQHVFKNPSQTNQKSGISIEALAMDLDAINADPKLFAKYTAYRKRADGSTFMTQTGVVMAFPVFKIKIKNGTGHTIRMERSIFKMVLPEGEVYDSYSKDTFVKNNLAQMGELESNLVAAGGKLDWTDVGNLTRSLKILDQNTTIAPGYTETFYLTFQVPTMKTAADYMRKHKEFRIQLFDLPSKSDKAGFVTETVHFDFSFPIVSTFEETVTQPDGSKSTTQGEIQKP